MAIRNSVNSGAGILLESGLPGRYCMQMTRAVKTRKNRKFNWGPVERDMDKGLSIAELSLKYSIPKDRIRSRRRERRRNLAESVLLHANSGEGDAGKPAPFPTRTQMVSPSVENALSISEPSLPTELTEDQLVTLLSDPAAFLALKPQDAENVIGRRIQGMLAAALIEPPEAKTLKDVATLHKMFRDANGLTADKAKGGNGLLSPPRSFGRRAVRDAEVVEVREIRGPGTEVEPDGGWPEGM